MLAIPIEFLHCTRVLVLVYVLCQTGFVVSGQAALTQKLLIEMRFSVSKPEFLFRAGCALPRGMHRPTAAAAREAYKNEIRVSTISIV